MAWGGDLATVVSSTSQACVDALVTTESWMGYTQSATATTPIDGWTWLSGITPSGFEHWGNSEPNDVDGVENQTEQCATFYTSGFWNDIACTASNSYVCSR